MVSSACIAQHMLQMYYMWSTPDPTLRTVCYYTRWSKDRPGKGRFLPENIDAFLCTHIIFAFAKLEDSQISYFHWEDEEMSARVISLKKSNPHLKILLSVGGTAAGPTQFSSMANSNYTRSRFVSHVTTFLRMKHFDGLDINWEHPGRHGSPAGDKEKFVLLMQELRSSFESDAETSGMDRLLLTGLFPAGKEDIDAGYDLRRLAAVMDFFSITTYNFHGPRENYLGFNSPLERSYSEEIRGWLGQLNLRWVSEYYFERGAPKSKMNLGIPTYGRGFHLQGNYYRDVGDWVRGPAPAGPLTQTLGLLSYYESCDVLRGGGLQYFSTIHRNPYMLYSSNRYWLGYENQQSVREKACYAYYYHYGGVMFWDLSMDDFTGEFCEECPYPLIWAGNSALHDPNINCAGYFVTKK